MNLKPVPSGSGKIAQTSQKVCTREQYQMGEPQLVQLPKNYLAKSVFTQEQHVV